MSDESKKSFDEIMEAIIILEETAGASIDVKLDLIMDALRHLKKSLSYMKRGEEE